LINIQQNFIIMLCKFNKVLLFLSSEITIIYSPAMPQDTRIPTPIVYSSGLSLDQIINTPVAPMCRMAEPGERTWFVNSLLTCQDGTTLSVQASYAHYCLPRGDEAPYDAVEVGYPSVTPGPEWAPYQDGSVYAYVPVELVREFIEQHGGEVTPTPH
jgi:hypothetical protein